MTEYRTIIVDDEPEARNGLEVLLEKDPSIQIEALCKNGIEAIESINHLNPDLLILDIQMPKVNGFEVLASIKTYPPAIMFTTAYDQYAVKAFEWHAIDYILKPYSDERFYQALDKCKQQVNSMSLENRYLELQKLVAKLEKEQNESTWLLSPSQKWDRFIFKEDGKVYFLKPEEILYFEGYDYYVKIHTAAKVHLIRKSLKSLEGQLDNKQFVRIHKSYIVNMAKAKRLEPYSKEDYILVLENEAEIKVSRTHKDKFLKNI